MEQAGSTKPCGELATVLTVIACKYISLKLRLLWHIVQWYWTGEKKNIYREKFYDKKHFTSSTLALSPFPYSREGRPIAGKWTKQVETFEAVGSICIHFWPWNSPSHDRGYSFVCNLTKLILKCRKIRVSALRRSFQNETLPHLRITCLITGKGGKNFKKGKKGGDGETRRDLIFKEDGQGKY